MCIRSIYALIRCQREPDPKEMIRQKKERKTKAPCCQPCTFSLQTSYSSSAETSQDSIHVPVPSLRPLQDLAALFREFGLAALVGDLAKEHGLPRLPLCLPVPRPFSLRFLKLLLDRCRAGKLLCVDGLGDLVPELKGFVWELLLQWREHLGRHVQRGNVDDGDLLRGGVGVLGPR